jgi:hypothetical protein
MRLAVDPREGEMPDVTVDYDHARAAILAPRRN